MGHPRPGLFAIPARASSRGTLFPFFPGEKMTFHVKWTFISAGEAVLETRSIEILKGVPAYHFVLTARSHSHIDPFYKVRARIDAYADTAMTHSVLFKESKDGKRKKRVVVDFNWKKNEAQYSNFGSKLDPIPIRPGSFDPLSVFYAFRLHHLKEGIQIKHPVTDGKKCVMGYGKVVGRERIKVAGKIYDTFLIEPNLEHIGGIFKKSKNAKLQIWVTADKRRLPVRVRSKIRIGSIVAELVSVERAQKKAGH
ncbi:MAG: DUF3108 domain-containing protein [Deltaproteobacteria bacterium]|nr:DUF3108 domain-containing protein [Deltaproteobacteria bacterium]